MKDRAAKHADPCMAPRAVKDRARPPTWKPVGRMFTIPGDRCSKAALATPIEPLTCRLLHGRHSGRQAPDRPPFRAHRKLGSGGSAASSHRPNARSSIPHWAWLLVPVLRNWTAYLSRNLPHAGQPSILVLRRSGVNSNELCCQGPSPVETHCRNVAGKPGLRQARRSTRRCSRRRAGVSWIHLPPLFSGGNHPIGMLKWHRNSHTGFLAIRPSGNEDEKDCAAL